MGMNQKSFQKCGHARKPRELSVEDFLYFFLILIYRSWWALSKPCGYARKPKPQPEASCPTVSKATSVGAQGSATAEVPPVSASS